VRAEVILCDHAQVAEGKLFLSGGGISWVTSGAPISLAVLVHVPWDQANQKINYTLELHTQDGPLNVLGPDGQSAVIGGSGEFEVGRPAGHLRGAALDVPLAFNLASLTVPAGRYVWRLTINDENRDDWAVAFSVRAPD